MLCYCGNMGSVEVDLVGLKFVMREGVGIGIKDMGDVICLVGQKL